MQIFDNRDNQLCLMQCNTNYTIDPDKIGYVNLNVLKKYKRDYPDVILGLSDHTLSDTSVMGAVALGAKVIEKHFTDDNDRVGPDHKFAINPVNWRIMVDLSRELTDALGDGAKKVEENEKNAYVVQRRCCVSAKNLSEGHIITEEDLKFLRPCPDNAVQPYDYKKIIGKKLKVSLNENEAVLWNHL
jgi:N-acetylneuraminate synthase